MYGAKELGLSIQSYFSSAENVVEGQMRMRARYGHDAFNASLYGAIEVEAWGGEVAFRDDGPPNAGEPFIRHLDDVAKLVPPRVEDAPCLRKALAVIAGLAAKVGDEVPILGSVVSPFSMPVMQLGFERYLEVLFDRPDVLAALLRVNEAFCVDWANAQLAAGATTIGYACPMSSTTMVPAETSRTVGIPVFRRVLSRVRGSMAMSLASGRCLPVLPDLVESGAAALLVSAEEDLAELKAICRGRLSLMGNLNGLAMRRWSAADAEAAVRACILEAGPGGGFVLSDNHGEVPFQVPSETLMAIGDAVRRHGVYPLAEG
jgi:uroporphyrinogen decarboxylase